MRTPADRPVRLTPHTTANAAVRLAAEVLVTADELHLHARVQNAGKAPIYVFDTPWKPSSTDNTIVPDPEQAFRFLDRATLRIVMGVPPLPAWLAVRLHYAPYATRVEPEGVLELRIATRQPVREYNPYFSEDSGTRFEGVTADGVELAVQYVTARKGIVVQPAQWPWAASKFTVGPISQLDGAYAGELLRASALVPSFPSLRRAGEFSRVALPARLPA
jgi:hypothetical protein